MTDSGDAVLRPGRSCWRIEPAERFALIIDAADYFRHAKAAMLKARSRIMLIGWDFDVRVELEPEKQTLEGPTGWGISSHGSPRTGRTCGSTCSSGTSVSSSP